VMRVALTGATGFIGSHILGVLSERGHEVTALVRNQAHVLGLEGHGVSAVVVDLTDRSAVANEIDKVDAAIHTASPGDATSALVDAAMVDAATTSFRGSLRPYLHTSGLWVYGANDAVTEDSPLDPPALVAWKQPIEERLLASNDLRGIVVACGTVYGDGGGRTARLLLDSPRDDAGNLVMLGSGRQHWSTVHAADLAELFVRIVESDSARGRYIAEDGTSPTVAELTSAAAAAAGARGAVPGSDAEARLRLGNLLAEVLLLDQHVVTTRARDAFGWRPSRRSLVEEFHRARH
jgi:nucleoside-diphosphate-sugar epimerase